MCHASIISKTLIGQLIFLLSLDDVNFESYSLFSLSFSIIIVFSFTLSQSIQFILLTFYNVTRSSILYYLYEIKSLVIELKGPLLAVNIWAIHSLACRRVRFCSRSFLLVGNWIKYLSLSFVESVYGALQLFSSPVIVSFGFIFPTL